MSVSIIEKDVFGNKKVHVISFSASAAEENIVTGLQRVDAFTVGEQSVTTSFYKMKANVNSTATVAYGTIGVSGLVTGDQMYIVAYGK